MPQGLTASFRQDAAEGIKLLESDPQAGVRFRFDFTSVTCRHQGTNIFNLEPFVSMHAHIKHRFLERYLYVLMTDSLNPEAGADRSGGVGETDTGSCDGARLINN